MTDSASSGYKLVINTGAVGRPTMDGFDGLVIRCRRAEREGTLPQDLRWEILFDQPHNFWVMLFEQRYVATVTSLETFTVKAAYMVEPGLKIQYIPLWRLLLNIQEIGLLLTAVLNDRRY